MKKVLIIGLKGIPAFGGAAAVGENLIKALKKNYSFTVLSVSSHTRKKNVVVNGITQVVFNKFYSNSINTLVYYLKSLWFSFFNSFDFVHLHHAESGFITPLLRIKYKVIVTFHGIYNYNDPKFSKIHNLFFRISERLNIIFANEIVSVSLPDTLYIYKKYRRKIYYIPNGINLSDSYNRQLTVNSSLPYILFAAGRIYDIKGLHLLLEAMKNLNNDMLIKVAGDINQKQSYKERIEFMSRGVNVEYLGLIKDKEILMQVVSQAIIFVFPSLTEAMSMMLLEVVSMKIPVIASDIPSNRAIFSDDEVLFFKTGDSQELMLSIKFALDNPEMMKIMAEKAYIKLALNYTWDVIAEKYDTLYKKLYR